MSRYVEVKTDEETLREIVSRVRVYEINNQGYGPGPHFFVVVDTNGLSHQEIRDMQTLSEALRSE